MSVFKDFWFQILTGIALIILGAFGVIKIYKGAKIFFAY